MIVEAQERYKRQRAKVDGKSFHPEFGCVRGCNLHCSFQAGWFPGQLESSGSTCPFYTGCLYPLHWSHLLLKAFFDNPIFPSSFASPPPPPPAIILPVWTICFVLVDVVLGFLSSDLASFWSCQYIMLHMVPTYNEWCNFVVVRKAIPI